MRIRRCARSKYECEPVGGDVLVTNSAGFVRFTAHGLGPQGFDDYFEVTDPDGKFLPELVFVAPTLRQDSFVLAQMFTHVAREQFIEGLQLAEVPATRGDLMTHALDCRWNEAAGLRLEVMPTLPNGPTSEFYLSRSVPIHFGAGVTGTDDYTAFGGFIGLEARTYVVNGRTMIAGAPAAAFTIPVYVRSGMVTFIDFAAAR
jgi:hypothetical protein